jgi:hypothetical protein
MMMMMSILTDETNDDQMCLAPAAFFSGLVALLGGLLCSGVATAILAKKVSAKTGTLKSLETGGSMY